MAVNKMVVDARTGKPVPFVCRQAFGYDADAVSHEGGLECKDGSLAVQSQKDEADINTLVERFGVTQLASVQRVPLEFMRVDGNGDPVEFTLVEAQELLIEARQAFASLPAKARERFGNDPMKMVEFCADPENLAELRKLGLADPEPPPPEEAKPMKVEVVNAAQEGGGSTGPGRGKA